MKKLSAVDKAYLFLRLVLIVAIWLVVALKTPLPDIPFPYRFYVLPMLIVFTIYSLIFTTGLFFFPKHHRLLYLSVLPLDLLSISFAVRYTGTSS
ncbi:MAG: hypothetical protein Q8M92_02785, partial [Candidatus Subteraquimicrobiales bacterium]|nr:hypothetical protein [Candidatus Subteraquimicrobiales bacterium]